MLALALSFACVRAMPPGSTSCTSTMPGDMPYTFCGAFCKPDKAKQICSYCKCSEMAGTRDHFKFEPFLPI